MSYGWYTRRIALHPLAGDVFAINRTVRRKLEEEVLAGVGKLAAIADAAAGRAADAELEAAAAARRAAWVQAVDALTAQKAAGQVRCAKGRPQSLFETTKPPAKSFEHEHVIYMWALVVDVLHMSSQPLTGVLLLVGFGLWVCPSIR